MTPTPSKSPDRHTFQRESYVKRQQEKGEPVDDDYLDAFAKIIEDNNRKWDNPQSKENSMEWDLVTTDWILEKVRGSETYAQHLYAALCNNQFAKLKSIPEEQTLQILGDNYTPWRCSWRYAGGIIADMQQKGDYVDWYCSGIVESVDYEQKHDLKHGDQVSEGCITSEIRDDLRTLGWIPLPDGHWENF